jgi:anti-sigma factor RsiW
MIDYKTQIKIQAFADGELAEAGAREIAALIAKDQDAAALHAELKNTRRALAGAEQGIKLPETREFFWSKISREIERSERVQPAAAAPTTWQSIARWLKPLGAVAAILVVAIVAFEQMGGSNGGDLLTASVDMDAITYRDEADGTTFVWFTDAEENGVANGADATTLN